LALVEAGTFGEQDFRLWTNLSNLAMTRREQGDAEGAEALYRRVLQFQEQSLPPESAEIAATLNNIGESLYVAGRAQQADPLLRRGLVIAQNAHDDMVIATTLNTLGLVLSALGEDARAEPVLRRAIALFERIDGPDSFNTGKAANNLASVYSKQGEIGKAAELQRRALPIYQRNLAPGDPLLATVMNNMAVLLMAQKQADQAEPYLRDALEIAERSSSDTMQTQQVRANLASLEAGRGNWRAAATLLEKVVAAEERVVGLNHPRLASSLANYSVALKHINHKAEAKQAERRANAILKSFRQNLHAFATRR
jgi:tetratricopeptide (TPR) repeat protein